MKEAVNFLKHVYYGSIVDVANILTAEAEGDKERLMMYLGKVKNYTESLIEKLNSL